MQHGAAVLQVVNLQPAGRPAISFDVPAGSCMAVVGASGSGKTLLLRAIADLDPADGEVFFDRQSCHRVPAPAWRRMVRYVAAEPGWWADTPRQHFAGGVPAPHLVDAIQSLGLQRQHLDQPIGQLSTGERLRLALIRALADDPPVLLLDEPTAALDAVSAGQVEDLIQQLLTKGRVIVLVSHDEGQINRLANARITLAAGRGPPSDDTAS